MSKIGVGITTRNRNSVFYKTIKNWQDNSINSDFDIKIISVDDASIIPVKGSDYRFNHNVGISRAKNKCIELLYDCDFIFLSDDDCFPISENWYEPYINSGENHLSLSWDKLKTGHSNGAKILKRTDSLFEYSNPCGCLLFFTKKCFEKVGGFNNEFKIYGYEHLELSSRIFNAGLTKFKFADIKDWKPYFRALDYECSVYSAVEDKRKYSEYNKSIYLNNQNSNAFMPLIEKRKKYKNIIVASFFNYSIDTQRGHKWKANSKELAPLINSIKGVPDTNIIIFTDCFESQKSGNCEIIKIIPSRSHSPNVYRWILYNEWVRGVEFKKAFFVDSTDVVLKNNPFPEMEDNIIYSGEELIPIDNPWMRKTQEPYLKKIKDYRKVISEYKINLNNCGLVGGSSEIIRELLAKWSEIHELYTEGLDNTTDMAVYNYLLLKHFKGRFISGGKVNTGFKKYEEDTDKWFRHK